MSDTKLTVRSQKKNETRQRLYEAACRLFSCNKFEEVKVEDITREAGFGKGTFFNYFESKEDVVAEMQFSTTYDTLMPLLEDEAPYVPRLKTALQHLLVCQSDSKALMRSILMTKFKDEKQLVKHAEKFEPFYVSMSELVEKAQANGEIRADIPSREVVRMVEQMYMGVLMQWCMDLDDVELAGYVSHSFDVLFAGLRPIT